MPHPATLAALRARDLNQLAVLQALLTTQSVTQAARMLDMAQPTLSKALERLRREFGDPLLLREGNRMRMTPRAQELLPLVEAALEQVGAVFATQGPFDPATARGRLRIGANDYVQLVLGIPLLRRLRARAPHLSVEFRPVGALHPEQLLVEGLLDLVIGPQWPSLSLRCEPLHRDPFVCVVGADNTQVPDQLDLDAFCAAEHLDVSPSGTGMLRTLIDRALSEQGGRREVRTVVSSFMCVPALLSGSPLVAVMPRRLLALLPAGSVRQVPVAFELPCYEVSSWWHNATHGDPLWRWVRAELGALARG